MYLQTINGIVDKEMKQEMSMEYNGEIIRQLLLDWYRAGHRDLPWRGTRNPYFVWLSEIMLQQTRVEAVKGYYDRFLKEVPDIQALSEISEDRLLKLWEGLGYYNRARNLKKAACRIMEKYQGKFPAAYEDVINLPGIGEYTAGAICSICYDQPTPAVDGNVLRVYMRLMNSEDNIDEAGIKKKVRENLMPLYEHGCCGELTQALMELGAVVCIPNGEPKCGQCPLRKVCLACQEHTWDKVPVRREKKKRRIEEKTVFVLHDGGSYGIRRRDVSGLLPGMWEFFHTEGKLSVQEAMQLASDKGFGPIQLEKEIPYTHVFSHVEWRMTAYYIACRNKTDELIWAEREALEKEYALPSAFKIFLDKEL